MKIKNIFISANAGLILLLLAACGTTKIQPQPTPIVTTGRVQPVTGVEYRFVTDKLQIPTTLEQSKAFALNVDGDTQDHADNLFGTLLSLLTSAAPNLKLQATLDQAVKSGQIVTLHLVKEDTSLSNSNVSWTIFAGEKSPSAPKFDGSDKFNIDSIAPTNLPITGLLTNGHFTGGPGTARVNVSLLDQSVDINLIGVRLDADINAKGCADGKMGGGITVEEFQGRLLPAIAVGLNQAIKSDQPESSTLLQALDSDQNGTITIEEIENNPLLMMAASPDLDLLDAAGKFNPGQDGVKDSYSIGLGFTCVPAIFTVTGD